MSTGWILKEMNPADLKNHPVNIEIYGTQPLDDEMLSSVKEFGVFQPIHCTKDGVVLGGHRRRQHAIAGKVKTVPVLMCRTALSDAEQVVHIVELNRFREKTMEQKAREYGKLAEAKAELARKRQSAAGKARHGQLPKNFTEAESGEAKDQAAADVGMSRPTAEKAAAVVEKIDELTQAGKKEDADKLRETLNKKSVSAAAREAGVAPPKKPSVASITKDGKRTIAGPPYDAKAIEKAFGALARDIDGMARLSNLNNSPGHRQAITNLSKALDGFKGFAKECDAIHARKAS